MATKPTLGLLLASLFLSAAGGAQTPMAAVPSRLAGDWRSAQVAQLPQSAPPQYRAGNDAGAAPANLQLNRMLLLLTPSAAQQQALSLKLNDLENPSSAAYHHWLTPAQYAAQFANSASDADAVVAWLQSEGFTAAALPAGRGWIEFSGTAAQVEAAFGAQVRLVNTAQSARPALAGSIAVPAALAPLVQGLVSLDGVLALPAITAPQSLTVTAADLATRTSAATAEALTPGLLAPLLHLDALAGAGVNGVRQSIALPARGSINASDVAAFRAAFGLPAQAVSLQPSGALPALADDQALATFAASWAGAAAPGAQIVLVPAASTAATDGVDLALAGIVDGALANTVVVGYSSCEAGLSAAHQAFYAALYQQAAVEGMAIVSAAGDGGASACTAPGGTAPVSTGWAVNGLASTQWNAAVGVAGFNGTGVALNASTLTAWSPAASGDPLYAGGGGSSTLYAAPSWQSQLASQTQRSARQLPDLVLPAALDSNANRGLAFCLSGATASAGCNLMRSGGSGVAAAIFGGIAALVAEQHGAQGSLQSNLYALANKSAVYADVQQGSTQVSCAAGSSGCAATGLIGFAAGSGFDLATGLGAVNAQALVSNWLTPMVGTGGTTVSLTISPIQSNSTYNPSAAITFTAQVTSSTGGATPTGTVTFYDTTTSQSLSQPITLDGTGKAQTTLEGGFTVGGNEMMAEYSGDTTYAAANSSSLVNVNAQASTTSLTITPSATSAASGQSLSAVVTLTVGTPVAGNANPIGTVTLNVDGGSQGSYTSSLSTTNGVTTATFASVLIPSSSSQTSHTLQAVFASSNSNYAASTSPQVTVNVAKSSTTTTVVPATTTPTIGGSLSVTVDVATTNAASALPSGTVTLTEDGTTVGTGTLTQGSPSVATIALTLTSAGTHYLVATYAGDSNYTGSTSAAVTLTAAQGASVTTLTVSPTTLTAGKTETLTATVAPSTTVSGVTYTLTGTVAFYDGTTLLGSATISSNSAVLSGITLATNANHTLTAVYSGDTNWLTSTSSAVVLSATVSSDTVVLTANYTVAPPDVAVVLTATVTPSTVSSSENNPSGKVLFYVGTTLIGESSLTPVAGNATSVATLTTQTLPAGTDALYAVYQGDTYYSAATSNTLSLVIQDFTVTASSYNSPTNLTIVKGASGTASFDIAGAGGFTGLVQVVCAVASQDDMTCTASPQQLTPPGTVTFVIQTFTSGTVAHQQAPQPLWPRALGGTALATIGLLWLPFGRRVRRRLLARAGHMAERGLLLVLLLAGLVGSGVGCTNSQPIVSSGTPLGVATVKITATAYVDNTTVSHSVYLTVNVVAGS